MYIILFYKYFIDVYILANLHLVFICFSSHYFGSSVDIHSGGVDLLFPHHENEEAQCCAYHNVDDWVSHWIHTGYCIIFHSLLRSFYNFLNVSRITTHRR